MTNFYQEEGSPEVFEGTTTDGKVTKGESFGTEEKFIQAGGIKTADRTGDQPYWANVTTLTPDMLNQGNLNLPDYKSSDLGANASDLSSGLQDQLKYFQQQQKDYQAQLASEKEEKKGYMEQLKDSFTSKSDILSEQQEKYGAQSMLDQITQLTSEAIPIRDNINQLIGERDIAMIDAEGKPISMEHIRGEQELISRKYDSRIASESARLSAKQASIAGVQGNLTLANSFITQAVSAAVFDYQQEVDMITMFMDDNQDTINSLDKKYQDSITNALNTATNILTTKREEETEKYGLVTKAAEYGVSLNVDNMTLDEAYRAYSEQVAPIAAAAGTDGTGSGDEELTGIDAAVDDAAREIIGMESFNLSTNESYWGIIDELATDSGMDRNYLDKLVIQKIQQVKGQPAETIQEVEENIGSDFESPTTSSTISGAGLASGQQDIQKQLQEQQVSGDQKRINDEKIRKARQDAIDNGLVFWINPITGQRKLTSQE